MPERDLLLSTARLYGSPVRALAAEASAVQRVSPCIACGNADARPAFAVEGVASPVVVCTLCGLGRFHPMPGAEEVRAYYPDEYYGEPGTKFQPLVERLVRLVGERHISFLSRGLRPGARILDVGCGRGVILGALADRGFEVHGVEVSAAAARGADPRAEIRIASKLADAGYPEDFFDEVLIWHVLEHLDDPRGTLEETRRILRPGARLIVAVPNFSSLQARWAGSAWFHLDLPRHLHHFPLAALNDLLRRTGFEVETAHHFSLRQNPFGWVQSALNRVPGLPRNGLYALLHRRAPGEDAPFGARTRFWLWFWLILLLPIGVGFSVLATAWRSGATVHITAHRARS